MPAWVGGGGETALCGLNKQKRLALLRLPSPPMVKIVRCRRAIYGDVRGAYCRFQRVSAPVLRPTRSSRRRRNPVAANCVGIVDEAVPAKQRICRMTHVAWISFHAPTSTEYIDAAAPDQYRAGWSLIGSRCGRLGLQMPRKQLVDTCFVFGQRYLELGLCKSLFCFSSSERCRLSDVRSFESLPGAHSNHA